MPIDGAKYSHAIILSLHISIMTISNLTYHHTQENPITNPRSTAFLLRTTSPKGEVLVDLMK